MPFFKMTRIQRLTSSTSGDSGQFSNLLKQVTLPFVPHDRCENLLRNTPELPDDFGLDESFVCAGGHDRNDTCEGDGGGPLVCPFKQDPQRYVQIGIVAWGLGCGRLNVPGVYASVRHGLCFIKWATVCKVSLK